MQFKLPLGVVSQTDIRRLIHELNALNDFFIGAKARQGEMAPPRLSRLLDALSRDNGINLAEESARQSLVSQLQKLTKEAPVIHVSFATEPPAKIVESILAWLRQNIHPHVLLQVGLQPSIAAGCILRTQNKVFDMSLRRHLDKEKDYLLELIKGAVHGR